MPRRKRIHPDALLLNYRQGRWYNEGPGEMEMGIKFEWVEGGREAFTNEVIRYHCCAGRVRLGKVYVCFGGRFEAEFGHPDSGTRTAISKRFPTLDEAKAWVEKQARAWLAEVTA